MAAAQVNESLAHDLNSLSLAAPRPEPLGLCYLPVELLDAIVAYLDQQSLCALVLTCKATKRRASQGLYRRYVNRDAPSKRPFYLFLRTLCESPELAAMVRVLDIRGWRSEWETATGIPWAGVTNVHKSDPPNTSRTGPEFISVTRSVKRATKPLKLFEETAVKIGLVSQPSTSSTPALQKSVTMGSSLKKDEDFVRLLRHSIEDAQIVLMLALLPGLKSLCVDGMPPFPTLDWYHFLKKSEFTSRQLRELFICGHQHADGLSLWSMNPAFLTLAPGLECLSLSSVSLIATRQVTELFPDKKLQELYVHETRVNFHMLRIMTSKQRLTKFRYKPALGDTTKDQDDEYSEDHILDSLRDSLQSLNDLALYVLRPGHSSRLADCTNIKTLEMPYQQGFCVYTENDFQGFAEAFRRRIAPSLSTLDLRYVTPSEEIPVALEALADLKHQGEFPNLNTLRLNFRRYSSSQWFPVPYFDMIPAAEKTFGEILRNSGLQLELAQTD